MALIELRDVCKTYDLGEVQVHALRPTTLKIERGEYVALLGPSGSGKSTLMNTLGCLDRPTTGSYLLDNEEIATMSRNARAGIRNRHIGCTNFVCGTHWLGATPFANSKQRPFEYDKTNEIGRNGLQNQNLLTLRFTHATHH